MIPSWKSKPRLLGLAGLIAVLAVGAIGYTLWQRFMIEDRLGEEIRSVIYTHDDALIRAGDKDGRYLTVLIPWDRTRFFIQKGEPKGFEYDLVRAFEAYAGRRAESKEDKLRAVFLPTPFAELIPLLQSGIGDIAAGGLTITEARAKLVDFSQPYFAGIDELVVSRTSDPPIGELDALAGRRIVVLAGSSYFEHLTTLSDSFVARGLAPITIVEANRALMSEDLLEMVHAGIIELTVIDAHIGRLWEQVLDGIRLEENVAIASGNEIAWAVSKDAPDRLKQLLDSFFEETRKGTMLGNLLFSRYYENREWIRNPLATKAIEELSRYRPLFEKYAEANDLDWRLVAAVAYQESGFDPYATSAAGARGLMQVLPTTAAELGVTDLNDPEEQIKAGTAYLGYLVKRLQAEADIDPIQATQLALAAYNAGPGRLIKLREATSEKLRLDPNKWFFNVERAAQQQIGEETVQYVANVNKYRLAYDLGERLLAAREQQKEVAQ